MIYSRVQNKFELKLLRSYWIKDDGLTDNNDLCSHGIVHLEIGDETLSDINTDGWCTTAAGLHLMRNLYSNYNPGDFEGQLIPCCGHLMFFNEDGSRIEIYGCNSGIDWKIRHTNNFVELNTEKGESIIIDFNLYKTAILNFASEVEAFYGNPSKKIIPDNELDRDTFEMFWIEWNSLKSEIVKF